MIFYIHDTSNDERKDMSRVASAVQRIIDTSKLYVTWTLFGEGLCVKLNNVVGHVVAYDQDSRTYTCEFDDTPAGRIMTERSRAYNNVEYNGHPQVCYGAGDTAIVTQVVLDHRSQVSRNR